MMFSQTSRRTLFLRISMDCVVAGVVVVAVYACCVRRMMMMMMTMMAMMMARWRCFARMRTCSPSSLYLYSDAMMFMRCAGGALCVYSLNAAPPRSTFDDVVRCRCVVCHRLYTGIFLSVDRKHTHSHKLYIDKRCSET